MHKYRMRPLQQSKTDFVNGEEQEGQVRAFTGDTGEVSLASLTVVEEANHSIGQHLMVVGDEAVLGVMDTFVAQQGAGGEAVEDL